MDGAGAESGAQVVTGVVYDMDTVRRRALCEGGGVWWGLPAAPAAD